MYALSLAFPPHHRRGVRRLLVRLVAAVAIALVGLPLLATPAQAVDLGQGSGVMRPGNVWYGSYLAGGTPHYCGDPIAGGRTWYAPNDNGGSSYGSVRTTTSWTPRTSGVGPMSSTNVHRLAYILGAYGDTTSNSRAAHVSYATRRLVTSAGGAPGSAIPSVSASIADGGTALLDESRTHRGPYAITPALDLAADGQTATLSDYRPRSATGRTMTEYAGTLSLSGPAEFVSNGNASRNAPADGSAVQIRATGTGDVNVTAHYEGLPSTRLHYRVPERSNFQRVLVGGQTEPVSGSATAQVVLKSSPQVITQTSEQIAEPGTVLTDHLEVSGLTPGATVTVESTLFGPFDERPAEAPEPPADALIVGTVSTDVTGDDNGEAVAETEGVQIDEIGFYVWFETIAGDGLHEPWPGLFGQVSETTLIPWQPQVQTQTSDQRAEPGAQITDSLHVSGLAPGTTVTVESTLYGPFDERPAETPTPPEGAPIVGTLSTDVTGDDNGEVIAVTEALTVETIGIYVWFETIAADELHREWPGLFGQVSETTVVPWQPHVETQTSEAEVFVGAEITDTLWVSGLRPGATVEVVTSLYGPFETRPELTNAPLEDAPVVGSFALNVIGDENGEATVVTPALQLDEVGYYVWHETIAADDDHDEWIAPFGQVSETTHVVQPSTVEEPPQQASPAPTQAGVLPKTGAGSGWALFALGGGLLLGGVTFLALRHRRGRSETATY